MQEYDWMLKEKKYALQKKRLSKYIEKKIKLTLIFSKRSVEHFRDI